MTLTDAIRDAAYALHEEWGPTLKIERKIWLAQHFPELSDADLNTLLRDCAAVNATVSRLAEAGADQIAQQIQAAHPFLTHSGLQRAVFLVNYYAWHDGHSA
jgi:hypothetical protein